jgi:hypothetical protein
LSSAIANRNSLFVTAQYQNCEFLYRKYAFGDKFANYVAPWTLLPGRGPLQSPSLQLSPLVWNSVTFADASKLDHIQKKFLTLRYDRFFPQTLMSVIMLVFFTAA